PEIRRNVQKLICRLFDRLNYTWVGVTGATDCNAGGEIQKTIAVHVPDFHAATMRHDKWIVPRTAGRNHFGIAGKECTRFGSGQLGPDDTMTFGMFVHA